MRFLDFEGKYKTITQLHFPDIEGMQDIKLTAFPELERNTNQCLVGLSVSNLAAFFHQ